MKPKSLDFDFPLDQFEELIIEIGWTSLFEWIKFWENNELSAFKAKYSSKYRDDWIWGLLFPLFSNSLNLLESNNKRKIIGISALPGTGKTSLGFLLKELSLNFKTNIEVISIDDFYLPSEKMINAVKENPWKVSRGFPGTHSTELMIEKLIYWKETGTLNVPVFDKSLRNGLGDRSHWINKYPDLVIIEGWFLGVLPNLNSLNINSDSCFSITSNESIYRYAIQENLYSYIDVWSLIDKVWHLKPKRFEYMNRWKIQQEQEMLEKKGSALVDNHLSNFLRMLTISIPHECFDQINSDFLIVLKDDRKLDWVGLKNNY